ncbi:winged helix-turn-helix transcriptional regulator [Stackebrandtia nassauensis]|uniref:Transcriptional regulator, HxlR family n=1 Tax=Stackebrandtia nassauensis (strain DSM 44728 / CIP 108903 / NRRL B-16338 / NBRC 102104 / LLR-40K-21) TaxID=446470 RepID=D3PXA2_STANL|nr:winged helix-turn-helix transcriptional regulator [Stackebrandtia nassauensis]ADD41365.1 transcriptional regulator, HxlR family [Stackebrandtia nassauensis DSM 44728]
MPRRTRLSDGDCAIAQSLDVVGEWWTLLVVRDVARGRHRFEELRAELGISRKVLTERLATLVDNGVLRRDRYSEHPPRHEYRLTELGHGLLPVLAALQDFGDRWLLGDGSLTATAEPGSAEAARMHALKGTAVPEVDGIDPIAATGLTVLYFYPATGLPHAASIPGGPGCTVESCTYRDRLDAFTALGATVHGVSTQRPEEQAAFARTNRIQFPLFSDAELRLATALRLPTFRAAGVRRIKRLTLIVDADRRIREVLYPIPDAGGSVADALAACRELVGT